MVAREFGDGGKRAAQFLKGLRSEQTRVTYGNILRRVIGDDPDHFLDLPKKDAESLLADYIIANRATIAAYTLTVRIAVVKSFCDEYEIILNWKQLRKKIPQKRIIAADRAPTREEIRKVLKEADQRERVAILIPCSSGIRLGGFEDLRLKHVLFKDNGIARLTVYAGEPEQYWTFISPEAARALKDYVESRKRTGEVIDGDSPVLRESYNPDCPARIQAHPGPMTTASIQHFLRRLWIRAGIRTPFKDTKSGRHEFKQVHGFRKFFKTNFLSCPLHGDLDKEVMMGHFQPYYKPEISHLEEQYLRGVANVTIAEAEQLKTEIATTKEEHKKDYDSMKLQVLTQNQTIADLTKAVEELRANIPFALKLQRLGVPPFDPEEKEARDT